MPSEHNEKLQFSSHPCSVHFLIFRIPCSYFFFFCLFSYYCIFDFSIQRCISSLIMTVLLGSLPKGILIEHTQFSLICCSYKSFLSKFSDSLILYHFFSCTFTDFGNFILNSLITGCNSLTFTNSSNCLRPVHQIGLFGPHDDFLSVTFYDSRYL